MIYPIRHSSLLLAALTLCLIGSVICQECHDTHMEFFSEYSLGKQDELNKTFTKIQDRVTTLNSVKWVANDSATYYIEDMKPKFFYIDSKQSAEILGNDTIIIKGGVLLATIDFTWRRTGYTEVRGTGRAAGKTDQIVFAKVLNVDDKNYIIEEVLDFWNVTFSQSAFKLERIQPATTTSDDQAALTRLLNDIVNVTTARHELEDEIDKVYFYYLNLSLYDERRHLDETFHYEWHNRATQQNVTVQFMIKPTAVDIQKAGITLFEIANIKDWPGWKCEFHGPHLPLNPKVYGGRQEFLTFDIFKNLIMYGIQKKILDTELRREYWESRFFQFFAGDLYEVIPKLTQKFVASDKVLGNCRALPTGFQIKKGTHESINVTMNYDCQLNINKDTISQFRVNLGLEVQGRASQNKLDFHVISFNQTTDFTPYQSYKVENIELAQHMVTHSLNRLLQEKVFGSGWALYPRDYPHFIVEDNYTIVYDSTHIDPDQQTFDFNQKIYEEELEEELAEAELELDES